MGLRITAISKTVSLMRLSDDRIRLGTALYNEFGIGSKKAGATFD